MHLISICTFACSPCHILFIFSKIKTPHVCRIPTRQPADDNNSTRPISNPEAPIDAKLLDSCRPVSLTSGYQVIGVELVSEAKVHWPFLAPASFSFSMSQQDVQTAVEMHTFWKKLFRVPITKQTQSRTSRPRTPIGFKMLDSCTKMYFTTARQLLGAHLVPVERVHNPLFAPACVVLWKNLALKMMVDRATC